MVRQYIGARYVVKIYENSVTPGSAEWEASTNYEPLTMVTYNNGSYLSKKDVPGSVGDPASNPSYWVQTGFYNGQIAGLQAQIDAINGVLSDYANDIHNLDLLATRSRETIANLILNMFVSDSGLWAQGGCYVKNNYFVQYFARNNSNTGVLKCFDLENYVVLWSVDVECYHGECISYNPNTDELFITGCNTYDEVPVNTVFVLDFTTPSVIKRVINLNEEIVGYVYDRDGNAYYGITFTTLYKYANDGITVEETIVLDNTATSLGYGAQGGSVIVNGALYRVNYGLRKWLTANDIITGKLLAVYNLPEIVAECRYLSELESASYDYDNDRFFVGFMTEADRLCLDVNAFNIGEVNVTKDIYYQPLAAAYNTGTDGRNYTNIIVDNKSPALKPSFYKPSSVSSYGIRATVNCAGDAINYARSHNITEIMFGNQMTDVNVYNMDLSGLNIMLNTLDTVTFKGLTGRDCNIWLNWLTFDKMSISGGFTTNCFFQNAHINLQNCTFNDLETDTNAYHLMLTGCTVRDLNSTYSGQSTGNYRPGGSIINGTYSA